MHQLGTRFGSWFSIRGGSHNTEVHGSSGEQWSILLRIIPVHPKHAAKQHRSIHFKTKTKEADVHVQAVAYGDGRARGRQGVEEEEGED